MHRWLVRFGYDGTSFAGWARQPGEVTVEGELIRGLRRYDRSRARGLAGLEVASRTDRGVSAVGNAFAIRSGLAGPVLLRQLNGVDPRIFCTAAAIVPEEFRVRSATLRTYRYFEPGPLDIRRWERAASLFRGRIDVRSFGRGIPPGIAVWRELETVTVSTIGGGACVELRARSFVWGMVRKIVGAIREHCRERLSLARLQEAIDGRERLTLPMAEPEGLVLWNVQYPIGWEVHWTGPNRHQTEFMLREKRGLWIRGEVLPQLFGP